MERKTQQVVTCPWCSHAFVTKDAQCPKCHLPFDHSADSRPVRAVDPHRVVVRGADCHQPAMVAAPLYLDPVVLPASHASDPEFRFSTEPRYPTLGELLTLGVPTDDRLNRLIIIAGTLLVVGILILCLGLNVLAASL